MPSSPGTSIERVSPSVDPKIHAGGPAPAVSIAPDIRFRKVRLEVMNAPSVKRATSRVFAARSEERQIYFECYTTGPEKERSQNRAGGSLKEVLPSERVDEVELLTLEPVAFPFVSKGAEAAFRFCSYSSIRFSGRRGKPVLNVLFRIKSEYKKWDKKCGVTDVPAALVVTNVALVMPLGANTQGGTVT
jgi:hypothetical protein